MDDVLRQAMAPVLRDLHSADIAAPRIEDRDAAGDPAYPSTMLWRSDGTGAGVSVTRSGPVSERVAAVADQVQEWAIETLWGHAPTNWPPCPRHPDRHPLAATVRDGTAVWVCPMDDTPESEIGAL